MESLAQPPSNILVPGRALGRYELLLPLAKGGMAQVWAARLRGTRGFQKLVAIKTILADAMDGTRAEKMFLEEATLAAQIHHPNVVGTLELGEHEGLLYLVMEWVNGEPLSQVLQKTGDAGGMPLALAVNVITQACKGLHAAHEARDESGALLGIVHRDVSPQNVLLSYEGTTKLVDFGIAKATARTSELTHEGELKGKFAYMAPEQVSGGTMDRRVDIFGMGVLLYALTTGRHPFRGRSAGETLRNICVNAPPRPTETLPGYPPALENVLLRALAKAPGERFATAHELLCALEAAVPESLGIHEAEIAAHLRQLFGDRASERLNEIRLAQRIADGSGTMSVSSTSVSSLRAVSIEQPRDSELSPSIEISVTSDRPERTATSALPPLAPRAGLAWPHYVGGALLIGIAALGWGRVAAPPAVSGSSSPGVPLPTGLVASAVASVGQPSPNSVATAAVPAIAAENALVAGSSKTAQAARAERELGHERAPSERLARSRVPAPAQPVRAVTVVPTPSTAPQLASPHTPTEAGSAHRVNAWNADNYGGRR